MPGPLQVGAPEVGDADSAGAPARQHPLQRLVGLPLGPTAAPAETDDSTLGQEKRSNPALRLAAEEFVTEALAGLDAYPAYYVHMGVANLAGPEPVDLRSPDHAAPDELRHRLEKGEWVVDPRHRTAYVQAHLAGTVSLGLDGPMTTWLGWMIDWGAPLTLLGDSPDQIARAQRELVRIGIDRIETAASGSPEDLAADAGRIRQLPSADFADLAAVLSDDTEDPSRRSEVVLDVRLNNEWNSGSAPCRSARRRCSCGWSRCSC